VNGGIRFLNPTAFRLPTTGTLGDPTTSQRNSIRGPGSKNIDLALSRAFRVNDQQNVEIRAEAFNALNWLQLGNPNTAANSATFGQITSTNNARVIQLAVKYAF
jgi:hypothetical protein